MSMLSYMRAALFGALALMLGAAAPAGAQQRVALRYECDLNGAPGVMVLEARIYTGSGIAWGPGVNPDIIGVIPTGERNISFGGEMRSISARYVFTGENQFADFTDMRTYDRFRVKFETLGAGRLRLVINPFGPGPTQHFCRRLEQRVLPPLNDGAGSGIPW